jgi:hypothetical protein
VLLFRQPPAARLGDDQAEEASRPGMDPQPDVALGADPVPPAAVVGDLDVEGHTAKATEHSFVASTRIADRERRV